MFLPDEAVRGVEVGEHTTQVAFVVTEKPGAFFTKPYRTKIYSRSSKIVSDSVARKSIP
jgi:hypothetical protein